MRFKYFVSAALIFSVAFGSQARILNASAITATTVQASPMQAASGQSSLYCAPRGAGMSCTDNLAKYNSWAESRPRLEDYRSSRRDRGISDYKRQHMVVPSAAGNKVVEKPRDIVLKEDVTVRDPITSQDVVVSTREAGINWQDVADDVAAAVPAMAADFTHKQEAYERVQKIYQQFYEHAAAENAAISQQLRDRAAQGAAQASAQASVVLPNLALGLASLSTPNLSQADLKALKQAQALAQSALSHRTHDLNPEAYNQLARKMRDALKNKDYDSFFSGLEPYTRGKVDGLPAKPNSFNGTINSQGVVNVSKLTNGKLTAPFDQRSWQTKLSSNEGEVVRRLANKYQQAYVDTNGLSILSKNESAQVAIGQLALALGDKDLANGNYERGSSFLSLAENMLNSALGTAMGVAEGAIDLVKSIPELGRMMKDGAVLWVTNPKETWTAFVDMMQALPELRSLIKAAAIAKYDEFKNASEYDRGRAIGHVVFDVATVFVTFGESAAVEALSGAGQLEALAARAGSTAVRASLESAADAVAVAAKPLSTAARALPSAATRGLLAIEKANPQLAVALTSASTEAQAAGRIATVKYVEKMMASGNAYTTEEVAKVAEAHSKLVETLANAPKAEFTGTVTRGGIEGPIEDAVTGAKRPLTEADLSATGKFNIEADHRLSIGGELGDAAQYWTVGTQAEAIDTISLEIGAQSSDRLLTTTTQISSSKLLDIRNPEVVKILADAGVRNVSQAERYALPQALGNAARTAGYDGIILESHQVPGALNVVLFK